MVLVWAWFFSPRFALTLIMQSSAVTLREDLVSTIAPIYSNSNVRLLYIKGKAPGNSGKDELPFTRK